MSKVKRIISIGFTFILMLCMSICFVGCKDKEDEENKKYDVSIRIACEDGGMWTFPPDVEELHIERAYDGKEHRYYIHSYQLVDHPRWGDEWFTPKGEGANVFGFYLLYTDLDGTQNTELTHIREKGEYIITVNAQSTSDLWNFRELYLYITVA